MGKDVWISSPLGNYKNQLDNVFMNSEKEYLHEVIQTAVNTEIQFAVKVAVEEAKKNLDAKVEQIAARTAINIQQTELVDSLKNEIKLVITR